MSSKHHGTYSLRKSMRSNVLASRTPDSFQGQGLQEGHAITSGKDFVSTNKERDATQKYDVKIETASGFEVVHIEEVDVNSYPLGTRMSVNCLVHGCPAKVAKICDDAYRSYVLYTPAPAPHAERLFYFPRGASAAAAMLRSVWTCALNLRDPACSSSGLPILLHPTHLDFVCSAHFVEGRPTDDIPFPTLLLGYDRSMVGGRSSTFMDVAYCQADSFRMLSLLKVRSAPSDDHLVDLFAVSDGGVLPGTIRRETLPTPSKYRKLLPKPVPITALPKIVQLKPIDGSDSSNTSSREKWQTSSSEPPTFMKGRPGRKRKSKVLDARPIDSRQDVKVELKDDRDVSTSTSSYSTEDVPNLDTKTEPMDADHADDYKSIGDENVDQGSDEEETPASFVVTNCLFFGDEAMSLIPVNTVMKNRPCDAIGCTSSVEDLSECLDQICIPHSTRIRDCSCKPPYTMYFYPQDEKMRSWWERLINRPIESSDQKALVCSKHFPERRPTLFYPLPVLDLGYGDGDPAPSAVWDTRLRVPNVEVRRRRATERRRERSLNSVVLDSSVKTNHANGKNDRPDRNSRKSKPVFLAMLHCPECNSRFKTYEKLSEHWRTEPCNAQNTCPVCLTSFDTRESLDGHSVIHDCRANDCYTCGASFMDGNEKSEHIRSAHGGVERCPHCGATFAPPKGSLRRHMRQRHTSAPSVVDQWTATGLDGRRVEAQGEKRSERDQLSWHKPVDKPVMSDICDTVHILD